MDLTPTLGVRVHMKNLTQSGEMPDGSLDDVKIYMYLRFLACHCCSKEAVTPGLPQDLTARGRSGSSKALWNRSRPQKVQQPRRLRVPAGLVRQLPSPELLC
jgi:hypothetical protein